MTYSCSRTQGSGEPVPTLLHKKLRPSVVPHPQGLLSHKHVFTQHTLIRETTRMPTKLSFFPLVLFQVPRELERGPGRSFGVLKRPSLSLPKSRSGQVAIRFSGHVFFPAKAHNRIPHRVSARYGCVEPAILLTWTQKKNGSGTIRLKCLRWE